MLKCVRVAIKKKTKSYFLCVLKYSIDYSSKINCNKSFTTAQDLLSNNIVSELIFNLYKCKREPLCHGLNTFCCIDPLFTFVGSKKDIDKK